MIRVLIVDDSPVVRKALAKALSRDPRLKVVGVAEDPIDALSQLERLAPDVLTLDVEMPRMDGLTFLRRLMKERPMPVVMCSSLARRSSELVLECLRAGAVSMVPKPHHGYPFPRMISELRHAVVSAAKAKVRGPTTGATPSQGAVHLDAAARRWLVAIGSSTGGTAAVEKVLAGLPADGPPVVLAQHLPESFVPRFVERLNEALPQEVAMATDGQVLAPGKVFVAPATHHLQVVKQGHYLVTHLHDGPKVNFHRPSVDVLFDSVARVCARRTVAVLLTGMGKDGAKGMAAIKAGGGRTLAQDEASCVVYGMPRAAVELGAVHASVPLVQIAARIAREINGVQVAA